MSRPEVIRSFIPDNVLEHMGYSVFIDLAADELSYISNIIQILPILTSPSKGDIDRMCSLIGLDNMPNTSDAYKRELLKRYVNRYKRKGLLQEILDCATQGNLEGYLGADLYVPGTERNPGPVTISLPRDSIFTHSRSIYSGPHKRPLKNSYQDGIIYIELEVDSRKLIDMVNFNIPAGLRPIYSLATKNLVETQVALPAQVYVEHIHDISVECSSVDFYEFGRYSAGPAHSVNFIRSGKCLLMYQSEAIRLESYAAETYVSACRRGSYATPCNENYIYDIPLDSAVYEQPSGDNSRERVN